jgi:hypothetical protein
MSNPNKESSQHKRMGTHTQASLPDQQGGFTSANNTARFERGEFDASSSNSRHDAPSDQTSPRRHNSQAADSPEAIIKRDNKAVGLLRHAFALLLVVSAIATVVFVYRHMSRNEKAQFTSEYESLASTLVSSLFLDLRLNFWIAHTLSKSVTLAMLSKGESATNFTLPPRLWESVTQEARFVSEVLVVSWIPFLYSDEERLAFEENVRSSVDGSTSGNGTSYPACHVCEGNPDMVIENEMADVEVHGLSFKCGMVYWGGRNGGIPLSVVQ